MCCFNQITYTFVYKFRPVKITCAILKHKKTCSLKELLMLKTLLKDNHDCLIVSDEMVLFLHLI